LPTLNGFNNIIKTPLAKFWNAPDNANPAATPNAPIRAAKNCHLYPQHLHQCDDQQSLQYDGKKILQKWTKGYIKPIARDDVPEPAVQHTDQPLTYKKNKKRKDILGPRSISNHVSELMR